VKRKLRKQWLAARFASVLLHQQETNDGRKIEQQKGRQQQE
jgi:hypothetical protein